jgi:hypothetical protein
LTYLPLPVLAAEMQADPYAALISLGPVGIILFLFIIGKIRTEGEVKRLQQDKVELKAEISQKDKQISKLTDSIMDQAIPTIAKSTDLLNKMAPLLHEGRR